MGRSPCFDGMCAVGGCRGGGLGRRGRRGLLTGDGRGSWWSATSAVRAARSRWTSTTVGRGAPSPRVPASMKSNAFSGCVRSPGLSLAGWLGRGRDQGKPLAVGGGHDNGGAFAGRRSPSWRPCRGPLPSFIVIFLWAKALVPLAGDGVVPSSRSFLKASPGVLGSMVGALR